MSPAPYVFINEPLDMTGTTHRMLEAEGLRLGYGRPMWQDAQREMSDAELIEACADADAVMGSSRERYTRAFMEGCPRLALISKYGIGTERIDVDAATELGIIVTHTPVAENYRSVAEHAIALALSVLRRLGPLQRHVERGGWRGPDTIVEGLDGKTVGLIGYGRIGREVANRLAGWGVELIAHDPYLEPADASVELVELDALLERSDVVSLHTVVSPETRGMLGTAEFERMKPTAVVVNTSRGALIHEAALIEALNDGAIAGAGLDVLEPEPPGRDNPLLEMDNVVLSPHTAGFTASTIAAIVECGAANLLAGLRGQRPQFVKNPAVLERPLRTATSI